MRSSTIASALTLAASAVALPHAWNASTVVTDITVTDYTTYCPASTLVTITKCDEECHPTTITVEEATTLTVTGKCVVPATVTPGASQPAATTPASVAPQPAPGPGSNGTHHLTTQVTVTDYTTYCPESTVVTVQTCTENKCAPHVVTVTEATTLTVTGECVVPTTVAPAPTTAPATHPAQPSTVAEASTKKSGAPPVQPSSAAPASPASPASPARPAATGTPSSSVASATPTASELANAGASLSAFGVAGLMGAAALLL